MKDLCELKKLSVDEWNELSAHSHAICFNYSPNNEYSRIDFALLFLKNDTPAGYCTVREWSDKACYWQFGGVFPNIKHSVYSYKFEKLMLDWCFENGYEQIYTHVENTNYPMIKMHLKAGFKIVGVRNVKDATLVELFAAKDASNG